MPMSARTQATTQFQRCTINRIENRVVVEPVVAWVPHADTGRKNETKQMAKKRRSNITKTGD